MCFVLCISTNKRLLFQAFAWSKYHVNTFFLFSRSFHLIFFFLSIRVNPPGVALHTFMDQAFDCSRESDQSTKKKGGSVDSPRALEYNPPPQLVHFVESKAPVVRASVSWHSPYTCMRALTLDCKVWIRSSSALHSHIPVCMTSLP